MTNKKAMAENGVVIAAGEQNGNKSGILKNKYVIVMLMEVIDGNQNGDPMNDGRPRQDEETGQGLISSECTQHLIRKTIPLVTDPDQYGNDIYISDDAPLNRKDKEAQDACGAGTDKKKKDADKDAAIMKFMTDKYYDLRVFGGVLTSMANSASGGKICGPVHFTMGRSIEPISIHEMQISRDAITTEDDFKTKNSTFGNKWVVPYGLYRIVGYVDAENATKSGCTEEDFDTLIKAIQVMYDHNHSEMHGTMNLRELLIFKENGALGNAKNYKILDSVKVKRVTDPSMPARSYNDYSVTIENVPEGVELIRMN